MFCTCLSLLILSLTCSGTSCHVKPCVLEAFLTGSRNVHEVDLSLSRMMNWKDVYSGIRRGMSAHSDDQIGVLVVPSCWHNISSYWH